jgi:hypothetical protein
MSEFVPTEKGFPIREASTANFLISSIDRNSYANNNPVVNTAGNFVVQKSNSLFNGFFTRIGVQEVVLNWQLPNVYDISGGTGSQSEIANGGFVKNASVSVDVSGGAQTIATTVPVGIYTISSALDTMVAALNTAIGGASNYFTVTQAGSQVILTGTRTWRFSNANNQNLVNDLGFGIAGSYTLTKSIYNSAIPGLNKYPNATATLYQIQSSPFYPYSGTSLPSLRQWQYIDFISYQLTYNQDIKDSSTATTTRDVLHRWYLSSSEGQNPPPQDKYGFTILPTYVPFTERRPFAFPKQIKWMPNMPIGQVAFEVWATDINGNNYLLNTDGYEWMMTMLVSEV